MSYYSEYKCSRDAPSALCHAMLAVIRSNPACWGAFCIIRVTPRRAGPTTAFGRVVGRQAYTKICAEQLCNICCEYHYMIYTHLRDNCVVYHHRTKMAEAATSQGYVLLWLR